MLTKIKFHGVLGMSLNSDWNLSVKSVGEAMNAINILSGRKFFKFLLENDKKGVKYQVLINGRTVEPEEKLDVNKPETLRNSELVMNFKELKSIDIVPVIEGADSNVLSIVAGVVLVVVGILLLPYSGGFSAALIVAGIGLIGAGVINLLSSPPKFDDFREIANNGGKVSYLFNGPQNTIREGGPVPVGYGRLLIGSQVVAASYDVSAVDVNQAGVISV